MRRSFARRTGQTDIKRRNGMKIGKAYCIIAFAALLCTLPAFCLDLEKDFRREIALYRIRPDQVRSLKRDSNGTPLSESQLQQAAQRFYDWLYPLDPGFLKRFNIREVVFKDSVYDHNGNTVQRRLLGTDLYLDADLDDKQFYASVFLLQVGLMPRTYLNRWNNLNPDGFSYEASRGSLTAHAQEKLDEVLSEWDKYFVSRTGMYSTEMDMALTFAYMIEKGPDATAFVRENSPTVQKKFDLIVDILNSVKAVGQGYMETLMAEDLSTLKTYSPSALSVRLFREFSGEWGAKAAAGEDGEKEERKPDDPVEVAGRRVLPLVLALETNDMLLFRLLMENKANPNVSNAKKTSALMLAIANNEPEQVKLLLEAGAEVTPDATRAGTAPGVNAEIVKLMNSYLPGVRQLDAPEKNTEKKKPARTSGAGSPATGKLNRILDEEKIGHLDLEDVELRMVFQLVDRALAERGCRIHFVIPPKSARTNVTLLADKIPLRDLIRLICIKTGLEMSVEEPDKVVLSEPKPGQKKTGTRSGAGSPGITKLNGILNEERFDQLDFERDLVSVFRQIYYLLSERGITIYFHVPPQYEDRHVAVSVKNVSLRELLRFICKKTGLEMSLEEPNIVIFSEPKQSGKNAGNKNGSAKKQQ